MCTAGFEILTLETSNFVQTFASAEAAIGYAEASSFGNFLGRLPECLRQSARDEIRTQLEARTHGAGIERHARRLIAIARRP